MFFHRLTQDVDGREFLRPGDPRALANSRIVEKLAYSFDWPEGPNGFEFIGQWSSRTAEFARWRGCSIDPPDVVIKAPHRVRHLDDVRLPHKWLELFRELSPPPDPGGGIHVAHGRGWLADPPVFSMNYIEGVELGKLLTEWDRHTDLDLMGRRVRSCGQFLARVHSLTLVDAGYGDIGAIQAARTVHNHISFALLRPDLRAEKLGAQFALAERYGDFAPYNLRVASDGQVWLFDPPGVSPLAPVHQDIACFLHALERDMLRRDPARGGPPTSEINQVLREAFLQGYGECAAISISSSVARKLIHLYDTHRRIGLARRRSRHRRFIAAARILGSLRLTRTDA